MPFFKSCPLCYVAFGILSHAKFCIFIRSSPNCLFLINVLPRCNHWRSSRSKTEVRKLVKHKKRGKRHEGATSSTTTLSLSSSSEDQQNREIPSNFPPLPSNIIKKIRSGKFIDFYKILPHSEKSEHPMDGAHMHATINSKGSVHFSHKDSNKAD